MLLHQAHCSYPLLQQEPKQQKLSDKWTKSKRHPQTETGKQPNNRHTNITWSTVTQIHILVNFTQHSTAQHSTAQHSTAQHSTAQHSTAQHSTAQHSTAQHSTAQHSTAQHSTAQHSTAQHSTAQHSTAQHRILYLTSFLHTHVYIYLYI